MTFGDISSKALIPYCAFSNSAFFWNVSPHILQEHVLRKSFQAQLADHHYFYSNVLKDLFEKIFPAITQSRIGLHISLASAISNVQELAQAQFLLRRLSKCIPSKMFHFAYQRNVFLLNRTVFVINASSPNDLKERSKELTELFFRTLPRCHYDRGLITPGSGLEFVLDNAVHRSHHLTDDVDPITGMRIHETVQEALFARRLGVKPEKANSEYHSLYYLLDRSKRRLGIFKPPIHLEPLEDRYGASEEREGHLAEVASYSFDRFLKTSVVPYTQLLTTALSSRSGSTSITGSFQFYVDGCDLCSQLKGENLFDSKHEELAVRLNTALNRELKFRNLEEFALFDLLTGNNDHHFENILLKKVATKVWDLVAIDNAGAFPWCHELELPSYKIHPRHWFKWSTLPQAQKPFSEPMVKRINALDIGCLEEIAGRDLVCKEVPSSEEYIEGKIRTLRDRADRIKLLANKRVSLREIAKDILTLTSHK